MSDHIFIEPGANDGDSPMTGKLKLSPELKNALQKPTRTGPQHVSADLSKVEGKVLKQCLQK
jgi:hypothetical protein